MRAFGRFLGQMAALGFLAAATCVAHAQQAYPTKPIKLVVGYGVGGVADITARLIAAKLSAALGQPVIVDNRPSAGGIVAGEIVAKAAPDGYTLLHMNYGNAVSAALFKSLPYDIERDFVPVAPMGAFDILIVTNKGSPLNSVADLIAAAKAAPDKFNVGTVSIGSGQHMAAELFKSMTGMDLTIVPFRGTPALITALKGDDIQAAFEISAPVMPFVKNGELKVLAVGSKRRFSGLPNVPTVTESGVPGYDVLAWNGIAVPANTPPEIIERLNREVNAALAQPDVRKTFQDLGIDPRGGSSQDLKDMLTAEVAKWKKLVETAKIEKQ